MIEVKRAILSVFNKEGLEDFAAQLRELGVEIWASAGTSKYLKDKGVETHSFDELTGFSQLLGGRIKSLHPHIFATVLARPERSQDLKELEERGLFPVELVVVELYPFAAQAKGEAREWSEVVEYVDIGGPSLIRAAAKNFDYVTPVVDKEDLELVLGELKKNGGKISREVRKTLALKVFLTCATYDLAVAEFIASSANNPGKAAADFTFGLQKKQQLSYGENPHQKAALYLDPRCAESSVVSARQLQGKELSYNNILDLDAALGMVREFEEPAAVVLKHNNPCGVARGKELCEAYVRARACDPVSAFGGVIGLNRELDAATAKEIATIFTEAVIAPSVSEEASQILAGKKRLRLLVTGEWNKMQNYMMLRSVVGGILMQERDLGTLAKEELQVVSKRQPDAADLEALLFVWKVAKWVKSNAIVIGKGDATVGIGAGQMSRVDSVKLAIQKAQSPVEGCYLASDGFFPFRDNIDEAAQAGIKAVIEPGGSIRDEEVIQAVDEHDMIMVFTGRRHFRH